MLRSAQGPLLSHLLRGRAAGGGSQLVVLQRSSGAILQRQDATTACDTSDKRGSPLELLPISETDGHHHSRHLGMVWL
ncbi:unnamed protein product [Cladocopium goreaui]|uniref:Uncharacterized protein n=1 Tax=Cladocopium goreaui TaxID=2562237 RepID=A0A9P1FRJ5_9DINO|nr:unnamed protein product [Cladocopium goreaui]